MKWTENYRVNANDEDVNRIVSISGLLRYMQDAANFQMEGEGPSYAELFSSGLAFVLSRFQLSSYSPIYAHDEICVQTWACESKGVQHNRCYRIMKDNAIAAEAVSVWALLDINTKRLKRVGDIELNYSQDKMLELDIPQRIKIPSEAQLSLRGEYLVSYADIDLNGHMNNTKYPDMLCGFLPDMIGQRVISMSINFLKEAPLGESIKIYSGEYDGIYYFQTIRQDGTINVEAEFMLEAL